MAVLIAVAGLDCLAPRLASAQDSVRAWYADGQVWVVWRATVPDPVTYAIYTSPSAFTNTAAATLVGRVFQEEWTGGRLKDNASDPTRTYTVPNGSGGTYTLAADEGLFVETVHTAGSKWYGVAKWGDTDVTNSVTASAVTSLFGPGETVECHVQLVGTTAAGNPYTFYSLWADGRQDENSGRPDYPVMANFAKNGAPHLFIVSEPVGGVGAGPHPAVWFLHGGGGTARQSFPEDRSELGLEITQGYLVAHDDRLVRVLTTTPASNQNTWFFGWRKNYDPFLAEPLPALSDTVINYTQRRLLWINEWMISRLGVNRRRVSILGHSVGSSGTNQMAKAYPESFATVGIFNNGFGGPNREHTLFGDVSTNLITNLVNREGDRVRMRDVWDMTSNIATQRDLPLTRVFHGKDDVNDTMQWDSVVVDNYRAADAAGLGIHLYWDERGHGLEQWDGYWSHGVQPDSQSARDDVSYQMRYRSNQAFPAFFNLSMAAGAADPGTGDPATGDPWGTWGGWHDWDLDTIVDQPDRWAMTAFLVGGAAVGGTGSPVDACPFDSITADIAIRRPQSFLPAPGAPVTWYVVRIADGDTLDSGTANIAADGLVSASGVTVYRDPVRVRIGFEIDAVTAVAGPPETVAAPEVAQITFVSPNPAAESVTIRYSLPRRGPARLDVFDTQGRLIRTLVDAQTPAGEHLVAWDGSDSRGRRVGAGTYFLRLEAFDRVNARRLIMVR